MLECIPHLKLVNAGSAGQVYAIKSMWYSNTACSSLLCVLQGCFHVAAQQPVLYTVQESLNLLSLDNQVR